VLRLVPFYDALAVDYDRFVDWKGRMAHELPFVTRLFEESGVQTVLDAACGTGQHAIAFARQGYHVAGTDLSAAMIQRARENAAAFDVDVTFAQVGLGKLATLSQTFDAVVCLGNSLPHLLTQADVGAALADFAAVLNPGGILLLQNRNFDQVWAKQERFMSPQSFQDGEKEWLFLRFYDFHEETLTFHMLRLQRAEGRWVQNVESTELRPIFYRDLVAELIQAGFDDVSFYGGYDGSAFDPSCSGDLIATATRMD